MSPDEVHSKLSTQLLKVLIELGVNLLNQTLTAPFSVVGKALHIIVPATP